EEETIGCAPAGDKSIIESRRWLKATPASLSTHESYPSGPRYAIACAIEMAVAARSSGERRPNLSHTPATPHIQNVAPDSVWLIDLSRFAERQGSLLMPGTPISAEHAVAIGVSSPLIRNLTLNTARLA